MIWIGVANIVLYLISTNFTGTLALFVFSNPMVQSPLGTRLLVNMKESVDNGGDAGTGIALSTYSTVGFNEPDRRTRAEYLGDTYNSTV